MNRFTQSLTVTGFVTEVDAPGGFFTLKCRSGDTFDAYVAPHTSFQVVQNLDALNNDRIPNPPGFNLSSPSASELIKKYVSKGRLLVVQGTEQLNAGKSRFDARTVYLLSSVKDKYLFEETHWWVTQTARLADQWFDSLFGDKRTYEADDWAALYHTNLNILGLPTEDNLQECAVLSRLIYGLSAA